VHLAVASEEPLQKRLASCLVVIQHLEPESFPDDQTWEKFSSLLEASTNQPDRYEGEGTMHATTAQMTDEEAGRYLREICSLFSGVAIAFGKSSSID
jgi:hypothetical protein